MKQSTFLILFILFSLNIFAGEKYIIKGRIVSEDNSLVSVKKLMLLEVIIKTGEQRPQYKPFKKGKTDRFGKFEFKLSKINSSAFYQIGTFVNKQPIASDYIKFSKGEYIKTVEISIPTVTNDVKNIVINKNVFYFEPNEKGLLITEVIHFQNTGNKRVIKKGFFKKKKFKGINNFQNISDTPLIEIHEKEGIIVFDVDLPKGNHQVFYQYTIDKDIWSDTTLEFSLLNKTENIEIIAPKSNLEFQNIEGENLNFSLKAFGDQSFRTQNFGSKEKRFLAIESNIFSLKVMGLKTDDSLIYYSLIPLFFLIILPFFQFFKTRKNS